MLTGLLITAAVVAALACLAAWAMFSQAPDPGRHRPGQTQPTAAPVDELDGPTTPLTSRPMWPAP